jgi:hypothetical protein
MTSRIVLLAASSFLSMSGLAADHAAEGCADFTWDVTRELAAMRQPAQVVQSGARILVGQHYLVTFRPQTEVAFALTPERPAKGAAPRAALVRFDAPRAGRYRVSLTSRHWIDIVAEGRAIPSVDHQGRSGCGVLHKVVEFELPAGKGLALQLSGQDDPEAGLAITLVGEP